MKVVVLYLVLLKATVTTFSGLASLPVIREDLVLKRHVLTDEQLDSAIVVTRTTPGPVGVYVVSIGYYAGGYPGAFAGWLAMITPALVIIPLIHYLGMRAGHPRARGIIRGVVLSSAGLLWSATFPIGHEALRNPVAVVIAVAGSLVLFTRKVDSLWVILAGAVLYLTAASFHVLNVV